jgi:hypothetical protein
MSLRCTVTILATLAAGVGGNAVDEARARLEQMCGRRTLLDLTSYWQPGNVLFHHHTPKARLAGTNVDMGCTCHSRHGAGRRDVRVRGVRHDADPGAHQGMRGGSARVQAFRGLRLSTLRAKSAWERTVVR